MAKKRSPRLKKEKGETQIESERNGRRLRYYPRVSEVEEGSVENARENVARIRHGVAAKAVRKMGWFSFFRFFFWFFLLFLSVFVRTVDESLVARE